MFFPSYIFILKKVYRKRRYGKLRFASPISCPNVRNNGTNFFNN